MPRGPKDEFKQRIAEEPPSALTKAREIERRAERSKRDLRALLQATEARAERAEELLAAIVGPAEAGPAKPLKPLPKRKQDGKTRATYLACFSDVHPGEGVRACEVNGLNEFNLDILEQRIEQWIRRNIEMLNHSRSIWDIRQMILWLGGDLMTGWIHEHYVAENFLTPTLEVLKMHEILTRILTTLLAQSDCEEIVVVTSNGNHGRITKKNWTSGEFTVSYEYMMYVLLERQFEAHSPRMRWQIGQSTDNVYTALGTRINFSHGHWIKGGAGVGGIWPSVFRGIYKRNSGLLELAPHFDVFGHVHQIGCPGAVTSNGSVIGYSAYAMLNRFPPEEPMQASMVFDEHRRRPVAWWPIRVKEPRRRGR